MILALTGYLTHNLGVWDDALTSCAPSQGHKQLLFRLYYLLGVGVALWKVKPGELRLDLGGGNGQEIGSVAKRQNEGS